MVSCERCGERYVLAHNILNNMTTLETDIKFQFSSSLNVTQNLQFITHVLKPFKKYIVIGISKYNNKFFKLSNV